MGLCDEYISLKALCCTVYCLIIGFVVLGTVAGIELGPRVTWNRNSETTFANVIGYDIYKSAEKCEHFDDNAECIRIEGWIIVDFPNITHSEFKFCDLDYYNQSIDECEEYLSLKYPIGDLVKIYYDPNDPSDTRLEKFNIGWAVFGTVVGILVTLVTLLIICCVMVNSIHSDYEENLEARENSRTFKSSKTRNNKGIDSVINRA